MQNMSNRWENAICNEYALKYAKKCKKCGKKEICRICTPNFADVDSTVTTLLAATSVQEAIPPAHTADPPHYLPVPWPKVQNLCTITWWKWFWKCNRKEFNFGGVSFIVFINCLASTRGQHSFFCSERIFSLPVALWVFPSRICDPYFHALALAQKKGLAIFLFLPQINSWFNYLVVEKVFERAEKASQLTPALHLLCTKTLHPRLEIEPDTFKLKIKSGIY
jgi:hypothetical protein